MDKIFYPSICNFIIAIYVNNDIVNVIQIQLNFLQIKYPDENVYFGKSREFYFIALKQKSFKSKINRK